MADYWPAFAAAGKETITLRQLLCHQAGIAGDYEMLPAEALYDWHRMVDTLAAEAPWWTPPRPWLRGNHLWLAGRRIAAPCRRARPGVNPSWRGLRGRWD